MLAPADKPRAPSRRLTVLIPAFNAAEVVSRTIGELRAHLAEALGTDAFEIIVIDDGSTDATATEARQAGAEEVVTFERNRGKGAAVRAGMARARGASVVFTDADLAYAPSQLVRVLEALEAGADVAIGSRTHADSSVVVPTRFIRQISGRLFNAVTRIVQQHFDRDTQCGLKGFRNDAAHELAALMHIDGFAFDVEMLHLAEQRGLTVVEVPVALSATQSSSVRLAFHVPQMLRDVIRIRLNESKGRYRRVGARDDADELPPEPVG